MKTLMGNIQPPNQRFSPLSRVQGGGLALLIGWFRVISADYGAFWLPLNCLYREEINLSANFTSVIRYPQTFHVYMPGYVYTGAHICLPIHLTSPSTYTEEDMGSWWKCAWVKVVDVKCWTRDKSAVGRL